MFNFETLETWHRAIVFADLVYQLTRRFPDAERFGLTNQMRRAAVSISSNIAEGTSRSSRSDYARFVEIATGSLFEVVSQATVARNQSFLTASDYQTLYAAGREAKSYAQRTAEISRTGVADLLLLSTLNLQP